ncbi:ATP-binding cassette domain-containing protein [Paracoccus sp. MC1854]|uniref:ABC transporter ATP-binding protein n=1 Tax=Paracoccus sp. MC1854 TaxID=2760306 RepID=UPI0016019790|nr:oligopeptide/dipeptide ABC transporter ATP-binding protein [Paracoccus sp. MC1854]MBB1492144.1 ATP-binding cassette domain-containing protein [Paracoccus sp. MC1854]
MSDVILSARGLTRHFQGTGSLFRKPPPVRAVDGVSLDIHRGETFAIVGESGSGKSTLARLLARLLEPTAGSVTFEGREIAGLSGKALKDLRRDVQFIFQDPFSSLNPRASVGTLIGEPLETHFPQMTAAQRRERVAELLKQVGLRPEHMGRYPHEFSGGQRQRIGIARALASRPTLVIGDEPVSALDVSVQAQVVNLLADLREALGLTLIVIAHDLAVIRHMSNRVAVMYLGTLVEVGDTDAMFSQPRHPYTRALLAAIPEPVPGLSRPAEAIGGEIPSPAAPPPGCRFHTRCPYVQDRCRVDVPELLDDTGDGHPVACHFWREIAAENPFAPPAPRDEDGPAAERIALYRRAVARAETATTTGE